MLLLKWYLMMSIIIPDTICYYDVVVIDDVDDTDCD